MRIIERGKIFTEKRIAITSFPNTYRKLGNIKPFKYMTPKPPPF